MRRAVARWGFVLLGILIAAWGLISWISPSTQCRGEEMGPGEVCTYAHASGEDATRTQTYEQRIAAARTSAPVVVTLGLLTAGFGLWLVRHPQPGARQPDQASSDIGP